MKILGMFIIVGIMIYIRYMEIGGWLEIATQFGLFLNLIVFYKWDSIFGKDKEEVKA